MRTIPVRRVCTTRVCGAALLVVVLLCNVAHPALAARTLTRLGSDAVPSALIERAAVRVTSANPFDAPQNTLSKSKCSVSLRFVRAWSAWK